MRFNDYQSHIDALRTQEAYPPFEDIRNLVLFSTSQKKHRVLGFFFFGAGALLSLAILFFFQGNSLLSNGHSESKYAQNKSVSVHSPNFPTDRPSASISKYQHSLQRQRSLVENFENQTAQRQLSSFSNNIHANPDLNEKNSNVEDSMSSVSVVNLKTDSIPGQRESKYSLSSLTSDQRRASSLFVSGGLTPFLQGGSGLTVRNASFGFRYQFSNVSSLIVEVRKVLFNQNNRVSTTSFLDTTISAGGQLYHNTIGTALPEAGANVIGAYSVGTGYRVAFMQRSEFSFYAELGLGASTIGAITSERVGMQYLFDSPFSFEVFGCTDELFASGSLPRLAFDFSAGINYSW